MNITNHTAPFGKVQIMPEKEVVYMHAKVVLKTVHVCGHNRNMTACACMCVCVCACVHI